MPYYISINSFGDHEGTQSRLLFFTWTLWGTRALVSAEVSLICPNSYCIIEKYSQTGICKIKWVPYEVSTEKNASPYTSIPTCTSPLPLHCIFGRGPLHCLYLILSRGMFCSCRCIFIIWEEGHMGPELRISTGWHIQAFALHTQQVQVYDIPELWLHPFPWTILYLIVTAAVLNIFGTKNWFCGRQFFHGWGGGRWFWGSFKHIAFIVHSISIIITLALPQIISH